MAPEPPRSSPKKSTRVLLVDDHPMIRQGLQQLFSRAPDLQICGEADSGHEALRLAARLQPDLAIVDLALEDMDGIDLIKDLTARHPALPVLVLSMRDESLYAERALRAGARGYVMKGQRPKTVLAAIREVLGGGISVSPAMSARLVGRLVDHRGAEPESPIASLSDREFQVFTLIGQGLGPTAIAEHLHLSVKTIETYRAHIKRKLNLQSAAALRQCAIQWAQQRPAP